MGSGCDGADGGSERLESLASIGHQKLRERLSVCEHTVYLEWIEISGDVWSAKVSWGTPHGRKLVEWLNSVLGRAPVGAADYDLDSNPSGRLYCKEESFLLLYYEEADCDETQYRITKKDREYLEVWLRESPDSFILPE